MSIQSYTSISPQKVGLIIFCVAFLTPISLFLDFNPEYYLPRVELLAVLWEVNSSPQYGVSFGPSPFILSTFELSILFANLEGPLDWILLGILLLLILPLFLFTTRLIFINHMINRYRGKSTRRHTWILGLLSESIFLGFAIMSLIYLNDPNVNIPFIIPLPLSFVAALVLLKYRPAPDSAIPWRELEKSKQW